MSTDESAGPENAPASKRFLKLFLQLFFSILILACSFTLANYYLNSSPKAKPKKKAPRPPLVQVMEVHFANHHFEVEAMGTIVGAEQIDLKPRISGEVTKLSPELIPGGFFALGTPLLNIDPTDYELNILQLRSEVAKARSDQDLEMGNQRIAQKEYEILNQEVSAVEKRLMLRVPQLGIAQANLDAVKAKLKRAEIDLLRTEVTTPFNAVILDKMVGVGSRVSPTTPLARLVGTDSFWVRMTVPVDQLQRFDIPANISEKGSPVHIYPQNKNGFDRFRTGRILRLGANLEQDGRMALIYAEVKDPLCLLPENKGKTKLLLGSFVRVTIEGKELTEVASVSRDHFHTNDEVWILNKENRLEIRKVDIAARTRESIFVKGGLKQGEKIITTTLSSPIEGSLLQVVSSPRNPEITKTTASRDKRKTDLSSRSKGESK